MIKVTLTTISLNSETKRFCETARGSPPKMPAPNWDRAAELTQTNADPGRKALSILGTLTWVNPDKSSDKDSKPSTPRGVCQPLKDPRTPSPHLDPATSPLGACGKARKTKLNLGFYRASLSPWTKKGKKNPQARIFIYQDSSSLFFLLHPSQRLY